MALTLGVSSTRAVVTGMAKLRLPRGTALVRDRWAGAPARLSRMDRFCALALIAVDEALIDAQLSPADAAGWDGDRTAVVVGSAYGCHAVNEEYYRGLLEHGPAGASPRAFALTLPSSPLGEITIHYGLHGPGSTVVSGLTAGVEALGIALADLRAGRAIRALVIAVDVSTPLLESLVGSAPDDVAAALVLELPEVAAARGASPRAALSSVALAYAAGAPALASQSASQHALLQSGRRATEDVLSSLSAGTHGVGPLFALIDAITNAESPHSMLLQASDPEGAAASAVFV